MVADGDIILSTCISYLKPLLLQLTRSQSKQALPSRDPIDYTWEEPAPVDDRWTAGWAVDERPDDSIIEACTTIADTWKLG